MATSTEVQSTSMDDLQREIKKRQEALKETQSKIEKLESHVQSQYTNVQDLTLKQKEMEQTVQVAARIEQRKKQLNEIEVNFQEFMKQLPEKEKEIMEKTQKLQYVSAELDRLRELQQKIERDEANLKENSAPHNTEHLSIMKKQLAQLREENTEFKGTIQTELEAYKQTLATFAQLFPPPQAKK